MSNSTSSTKDETALNSFINEKEELNQEISELKTNFTEPKNLINEKYLLSEDLKDCLFELNCENMVMKYSIKKIGKKEYKGNSNDIYTALNYYDILINGISDGFYLLLDYINSFEN